MSCPDAIVLEKLTKCNGFERKVDKKWMVLKEVAVYKIVDNFGNSGWIWLKF